MRGTRAKDLMKIAMKLHDPKFADQVNMMKIDKQYRTGGLTAQGFPQIITMPFVVHQNHPNSIRGTYRRAKKAFRQFKKAGAPVQKWVKS